MPAIPVIYFLGQTLGFTVGPLNAYPTLATIATANLKFLLATACNTDFAYALMAEIGELLGFIPMPVCRELAPGGAGPRNLAPAVAGGNIPDGKRPNYAGRLETRVWTAWDTEAYAYAPLFDISAANVVEAYQTFQQCEDAFLVSKVDRTLCNIAGMFQMGYRTNVCGANFNTGVNGPPAASMAGLRRLNLSNTNFVDGSAYGAFIGQYRVISTPVHVYILISMDYGEQMIACLQHISLTATTDDRSWGAIISDDSPVAYIPLWHCRKKSGRQLEQYFIPTYAQVKSWSERAAVIMGRMIQLGIPIKTVGAADVYAYVLEMENEGADFIQAIMCLSAVLQGVRANNGRNDRWVSTRALEITVQGVSASSSRRRVQRRRHPPRPRRGPPRAKAVARSRTPVSRTTTEVRRLLPRAGGRSPPMSMGECHMFLAPHPWPQGWTGIGRLSSPRSCGARQQDASGCRRATRRRDHGDGGSAENYGHVHCGSQPTHDDEA